MFKTSKQFQCEFVRLYSNLRDTVFFTWDFHARKPRLFMATIHMDIYFLNIVFGGFVFETEGSNLWDRVYQWKVNICIHFSDCPLHYYLYRFNPVLEELVTYFKFRNICFHCTENHIFFCQTSWKDGLSKNIALEYDLSCIIRKDDISFSRKYDLTR